MKMYQVVLAAGCILLAAAGCCQKGPKVTALVAGEEAAPVAVVVEYAQAVQAGAVTPETFVVPGGEIAFAFVADQNPAEPKECCKGEKPECCKEGKPECCKGDKPECCKEGEAKPECCKGEKPACCKEGKPECCKGEKPACCKEGEAKPDCCKGEKPECCKEGKPECCKGEKPECCKGEGKCPPPPACCGKDGKYVVVVLKAAPAELTIQQAQDVAFAEGGAAKAWAKPVAVKCTVAAPPCGGPHHHHPCPPKDEEPKPEN